ncbi:phage tail protein [uncultured Desulfuromusa sp.]|uniref:phage tail protein n=1 Tax=uncultured Desulfuromusa sp. TaxID=219183 RepID=UPI002AA60F82|nr:phage tail protein [uncultured Desulfuromusa sp.]
MTKTTIMMALGDFRFGIDTAAYQKLSREVEYRWPVQNRVGRRPAKQFIGIGTDSISLDGVILPGYRGGFGQIDALRELAGKGQPLLLIDGTGRSWGKWCVERVEESQTIFFSDGVPRKQEFRIKLGHYGDDS